MPRNSRSSAEVATSPSVVEGVTREAVFDRSGMYRYQLRRRWRDGAGATVFVLLNPSTADDVSDDPTVRRCMGYARGWGSRELRVVNIFAYRATDPADMKRARDPVGPENDAAICDACRRSDRIVLGWGAHGAHLDRGSAVLTLLRRFRLHCLGTTRAGAPRHPLYLRGDAPLRAFPGG